MVLANELIHNYLYTKYLQSLLSKNTNIHERIILISTRVGGTNG